MSIDRVVDLKALHLYGMAAAWSEWLAEFGHQQKPVIPEVWLDRLIAAEQAYRQSRSLNYQLRAARFPIHRDLLNFNWHETPLAQHRVEQLATAGFMAEAHNVILVGGTGTGKTQGIQGYLTMLRFRQASFPPPADAGFPPYESATVHHSSFAMARAYPFSFSSWFW